MMRLILIAITRPALLNIGPVLDWSRPVPTRSWKSWLAPDQDRTTLGPCPGQTAVPCILVRSRSGPGLGPVPLGTVTSLYIRSLSSGIMVLAGPTQVLRSILVLIRTP